MQLKFNVLVVACLARTIYWVVPIA